MSFLTGSQVYGEPGDDSDVDLVIRLERWEADILSENTERNELGLTATQSRPNYMGGRRGSDFKTLRFGKLNLIICFSDEAYEAWTDGTDKCIDASMKGDFSRDKAVAIFDKLFRQRHVCGR